MDNLNKVRMLSPRERRLLVQAALLLPVIHLALLRLGFARLQAWLERSTPLKPIHRTLSETEALQRAQEITRLVSIAAQYGLYKATCLRKSLLVWWFLRREGIQSKLCFGVRLIDRTLEAHAWVEWNGTVVNDPASLHEQYKALQDVPPVTTIGS